jgi:ubiquinone/menaquinone biosynthesis C-methylase UbiE
MHDTRDVDSKAHWEAVYGSKAPAELSWYQSQPTRSLELLDQLGVGPSTSIIDVGGGASTLVDALLDRHLGEVTVLDISGTALQHAKRRLGARGIAVVWIEADITHADLEASTYDVWHDRAVFHFLTNDEERRRYVAAASRALRPGGAAVIATFSLQGPMRCSGLDVMRYDAERLARAFGSDFSLERTLDDVHHTPSGGTQAFTFTVLRRR